MTAKRLAYATRYHRGPYRIARFRRSSAWYIVDDRTGRAAWTRPHPVTGRPIPEPLPSLRAALAILDAIA